jgi:hypothetical protein
VLVDLPVCSLRDTLGIITLVARARERGLNTVSVPAIDAREVTPLGGVQRSLRACPAIANHWC